MTMLPRLSLPLLLPFFLTVNLLDVVHGIHHFNKSTLVSVQIPTHLHRPQGEGHLPGRFGFTSSYFGSLSSTVFHVKHSLCPGSHESHELTLLGSDDDDKNHTDPHPDDKNDTDHHHSVAKPPTPFILMATASAACTAVDQVRVGQFLGAEAVVLVEADCRCGAESCTSPNCSTAEAIHEFMVNDGSGGDITIPNFIIRQGAGERIEKELEKHQPVLLELAWGLPDKSELEEHPKVHWKLWTTAHDDLALDLSTYQHFRAVAVALEHHAMFTPFFALIEGSRFHCRENAAACADLCTNHGRYCANVVGESNVTGAEMVEESLRRLCIFHHAPKPATIFWDYVLYHKENCKHHRYNKASCIEEAMKHAKIEEISVIEQCIKDSGIDDDAPNHFLEEQLKGQKEFGITTIPSMTISTNVITSPNSFSLFEDLCRHFFMRNLSTTPDICFACATCANKIGCVANEGKCVDFEKPEPSPAKKDAKKKRKGGWGWALFWMVLMFVCGGGGYILYKRQQGEAGVGLLNDYMRLST